MTVSTRITHNQLVTLTVTLDCIGMSYLALVLFLTSCCCCCCYWCW